MDNSDAPSLRRPNIDYHVPWKFRSEAIVYAHTGDAEPNLFPFGGQLRKWMLREDYVLPILTAGDGTYTNPYTVDISVLVVVYAEVTNDLFVRPSVTPDSEAAEIRRIRLINEFVLYTARICEALIKQLLYVTNFPEGWYRRAGLRRLLTQPCSACGPARDQRHRLSLVGSLGHGYGLCSQYEHCLDELVGTLASLRDKRAAHSGMETCTVTTATDSYERLIHEGEIVGEQFLHGLQHIADLETNMLADIRRS